MKFPVATSILTMLSVLPSIMAFVPLAATRRVGATATTTTTTATAATTTTIAAMIFRRHSRRSLVCAAGIALPLTTTTTICSVSSGSNSSSQRYSPRSCNYNSLSSIMASTTLRGGAATSSSSALFSDIAAPDAEVASVVVAGAEADAPTTDTAAATPKEIFRTDYQPLPYKVTNISMNFDIQDGYTIVTSDLTIVSNPDASSTTMEDLIFDGEAEALTLLSIEMNEKELQSGIDYKVEGDALIVPHQLLSSNNGSMVLTTRVKIIPETNTQLSGLYKSGSMYCTQCEAMGFRRITYYPDRPDNMAIFDKVRIEANKELYPVLLGNGNKIEEGKVDENGRHFAIWSDPFPKPSYLFCIVAGNLGSVSSTYTTRPSGRTVHLEVFSEHENVSKLDHALTSLKKSMMWDEDTFGLEYDLDVYNIVAVNDFNMGAMENKGLNVFNTALTLADPKSATDSDYERIESVVGHEYFHNWTGNRVTCRDWFQLTLKEGLTVYRDQEFSGDMMNSHAVKRIEDVNALRARQFAEDAGPMSHPIRPESYISMDNFYTATVYEKGAEVIRMYRTLLGKDGFRKGMDLYFKRHDGNAVTCDDFLSAMADANEVDLSQFKLWYSTNGTPTVKYGTRYDEAAKKFYLTLSQESSSDTPLHIPVAVGLLDSVSGKEVVPTKVLELKEKEQTFEFPGLDGDVVPSVLRGFSAPVKLVGSSSDEEKDWAFLAANDSDGFNRWEAGQKLYTSLIFQTMKGAQSGSRTLEFVFEAFRRTLDLDSNDYSIQAYGLILPSESTLAEELDVVDPVALHKARGDVKKSIARQFYTEIRAKYDKLTAAMQGSGDGDIKLDATSIGQRRLRNVLLDYLCSVKDTPEEREVASQLAMNQFQASYGMTDRYAALSCLASMHGEASVETRRDTALQKFYDDAEGDALILNKWFTVQAVADLPDVLHRVKSLVEHPDFTLSNPNRCRSLISAFSMNAAHFHAEGGEGYKFLGEIVAQVDKLNPQMSSRMGGGLIQWRKYSEERGALMKEELHKLANMKPISPDLFEVVSRGLK
ncbi:hypothetical protein ACHAWU_009638 [Discostella pseudostelligera]|uniref:Aminopeptidase N n=1 Tax=Discostella pseudostelligera TaxID=259834 RepID=A0ABD3MAE1_9STRA